MMYLHVVCPLTTCLFIMAKCCLCSFDANESFFKSDTHQNRRKCCMSCLERVRTCRSSTPSERLATDVSTLPERDEVIVNLCREFETEPAASSFQFKAVFQVPLSPMHPQVGLLPVRMDPRIIRIGWASAVSGSKIWDVGWGGWASDNPRINRGFCGRIGR